ncbi:hypothetical protein [Bifidobacterium aerophilum]|uniref:Uncharacterized protein n=1 Tax=Bifidobacterium aerophilum TaxID=1798155 RepID=A0A6N9Z1I8_9BIFI|nr:hypothetical protein [Bifidobacterium aerophilum]NEG88428.1 hypothetical protein [Bifidobacterium aerophilum]
MTDHPLGERTRAYLLTLPAVRDVIGDRIYYTDEFIRGAVEQDRDGVDPMTIFDKAGLYPKLIGHQRILSAMRRWRASHAADESLPTYVPDARDRLIAEQALRIRALEREIEDLRRACDGATPV